MNQLMRNGLVAATALSLAGAAAPSLAADAWIGGARESQVFLSYGEKPPPGEQPNAETLQITLSCVTGSGTVRVFVAESSEKLKPGGAARLTLSAAQIATTVRAKILPNQLAGIPSLQATAPAGSAVFIAMARLGRAGRGELRVSAGEAWSARFPLKTMGVRADTFLRACLPRKR